MESIADIFLVIFIIFHMEYYQIPLHMKLIIP